MKCLELKPNLYYIGVIDHSLKVFDIAVLTDYGSSYNSYLLKTNDGIVVFEGCKVKFQEDYFEHIKQIAPLSEIKYLVVTHTEPDHSGSIEKLLELNPFITIIASYAALLNLDKIIRKPFKRIQMNPTKELKIGQYTFQFVSGLLLHWPDVMFTYIKELKTLISCDAFGAHFASDAILLSREKDQIGYQKSLEYYFMSIMKPFASYVLAACDRVSKLDIDMICPGHGPVIDKDVGDQIATYRRLANEVVPVADKNHVTIVYASAYGYTRTIAKYLAQRFEKDGKVVSCHEIDALNYQKEKPQILEDIRTSGLVLLGSPTIVGDAICFFYDLLSSIYWTTGQSKKASTFGDYGWSGEATRNLAARLSQLRFTVIPSFRWSFKLDEEGDKELSDYYESLVKAL